MSWGSYYTASGTYTAAGTSSTFNVVLPAVPSGGNGTIIICPSSGAPMTGAITGRTASGCSYAAVPAASSGEVHAIVGHSIIA